MGQKEKEQQAKQLLAGAEGKRLMGLLSQDGGGTLRAAGEALKQGNTQQVKDLMGPLLKNPEVQKILHQMENKLNDG